MPLPGSVKNFTGGGYVTAAAMLGGQAAGYPVVDVMTPNVTESAYMGVLQGAGLVHKGGMHFGGMFGYKTLFTGVRGPMNVPTMGNAVLTAIESVGKHMYDKGVQTTLTAWASSARETGLAGLQGSYVGNSIPGVISNAKREEAIFAQARRRIHTPGTTFSVGPESAFKRGSFDFVGETARPRAAKFSRFMGGMGEEVEGVVSKIVKEGGEDVIKHFPKFSTAKSFLIQGGKWAAAGTLLSAYSWFELLRIPVQWGTENYLKAATAAAGDLKQFMGQNRLASLGRGFLGPSFQNQHAATERQRAVQAIYSAKVNPSSRMFGNEARNYHR